MEQIRQRTMRRTVLLATTALSLVAATPARPAPSEPDAGAVYRERCASCHGERRYGGYAPPLIPATVGRRSDDALATAILDGLPNTQMPAFRDIVDAAQARALVGWIREPVREIRWSLEDVATSRVEVPIENPALGPAVRRENLILVVERGKLSVSVLDGDRMTELDRFEIGRIHGGIKFDRELRSAFASTRDGTVVAYDLLRGGLRTKVKVGVNTRNIAVSPDGGFVAAANQLPAGLVVLDGKLQPVKVFPLEGQPSAVYQLPGSDRFVVALRHPRADDARGGSPRAVPGFRLRSGDEATRRQLARGQPPPPLRLRERSCAGDAPDPGTAPSLLRVLLLQGRCALRGVQPPGDAASFHRGDAVVPRGEGDPTAGFGLLREGAQSFRVVKEIPLRGSGYFARAHPGSPYLWVDTHTDEIQLVAKDSLELVDRTLRPEAGKKAMHVEFTVDGDRALVSVWHDEGAVVVYDSKSLEELQRLPYAMPVGKYNAGNKTRLLH
jgi:mono/diheme cytochrome c family protein